MKQYPHYLYKHTTPEATQNANGSWVQGTGGWSLVGACREETNGKGSSINTADGRTLVFASLIQLPVGTSRVDEGTEVFVTETELTAAQLQAADESLEGWRHSGLLRIKGTTAKFDNGRLHCRLWI